MNPQAGNFGDVIKHLILAEIVANIKRPLIYIDPYAGRAENHLAKNKRYRFNGRTNAAGWADSFCREAQKDERLKNSAYVEAMKSFNPKGFNWIPHKSMRGTVLPKRRNTDPVYPGSVGLVRKVRENALPTYFICADTNRVTRGNLRGKLKDNKPLILENAQDISDNWEWLLFARGVARRKVSQTLPFSKDWLLFGLARVLLVDPFNLTKNSEDGCLYCDPITKATQDGAIVIAWYPRGKGYGEIKISQLLKQAPRGTLALEIKLDWPDPPQKGTAMTGAGVYVANLSPGTALNIGNLVHSLAKMDMWGGQKCTVRVLLIKVI